MPSLLINRILTSPVFDEPSLSNPALHFERIAFVLGQHAWLKAKLDAMNSGYLSPPKMPSFVTEQEVIFWEAGILAEMEDCDDALHYTVKT